MPVIASEEACPDPNWPYADNGASGGGARVVGFVAVNFTRINCWNGPPGLQTDDLTIGSCDDTALAEGCVGAPNTDDNLILFAEINCRVPVPTSPPTFSPILPRLVR
jgi:hypothetical protein